MAAYPRPRYNTNIFVYENSGNKGVGQSVPTPIDPPKDLDVTEMERISQRVTYSLYYASYPWLPEPNKKFDKLYTIWVEPVFGENYLTQIAEPVDSDTLTWEWKESWTYYKTGDFDPIRIQAFGNSIPQYATATIPTGIIAIDTVTLQRDFQPFVLSWSGTPSNDCITLEIGNFKLSMQSDYSVIYYIDDVQVGQSIPLLSDKDINMFGFSGSYLLGPNRVIDSTETKAHTRASIASPVEYTTVSNDSMPIITNTGPATWTFKNAITLHGLNLYISLTLDNIVYEGYLIYDTSMAKTDPPTYPTV